MRLLIRSLVVAGAVLMSGGTSAWAQNAEAEKTIIAQERGINEAMVKSDAAAFQRHIDPASWTIDATMGRAALSDFLKGFAGVKLASWTITDTKVYWVDATTAVLTYKWTGKGTFDGQPMPSPVWASTVWTKKGADWTAMFHQESLSTPPPAAAPKK